MLDWAWGPNFIMGILVTFGTKMKKNKVINIWQKKLSLNIIDQNWLWASQIIMEREREKERERGRGRAREKERGREREREGARGREREQEGERGREKKREGEGERELQYFFMLENCHRWRGTLAI